MSDKEIIVASLRRVERRIWTNRLLGELTLGATLFLAFPLILKTWDLFSPLRGRTVTIVGGVWLALFAGYIVWRILQRETLSHAAASIDRNAGLHDEIKTAFWFINNPRPSEWVDLQIRRAAGSAQGVNLDRLYPRHIPRTSYIAAALILAFVALNFVPLSLNHNWLALQAAPAFSLTPEEAAILKETEALLRQAEKLNQSELVEKLEEIIQQLQEGTIDAAQAAEMLGNIQSQLDEGNLDLASISEGLEEIAQDLEQSEQTQGAAQALKDKQLKEAAEEMRKLAEKLDSNDPESMKDVQNSLQQASENQQPGLEELLKQLKEAAENLKDQDQEGAQQALNQVAQEFENIQQKMLSQDLKNMAARQLQNLEKSLRQRQQGSNKRNQQAQNPGQPQNAPPQEGEPGQQDQQGDAQQQAGAGTEGDPTDQEGQPGEPGASQEATGDGGGLMPSGKGGTDGPREGAPTKLDVKLQQEGLKGMEDRGAKEENLEEVSKQERSKLDYRNVKSELSPAQKDLLNQDRIPWEYRPLIKGYFQAIRPPAKK